MGLSFMSSIESPELVIRELPIETESENSGEVSILLWIGNNIIQPNQWFTEENRNYSTSDIAILSLLLLELLLNICK